MKVLRWLDEHFEETLMIILMAVITIIMVIQVILRYAFNAPLYWAEEFCRYGLVWSTFVSIGYCVRQDINLHVDLLDKLWPPKVYIAVQYLIKLICLFFFLLMLKGSWEYTVQSKQAAQVSAAMQIPVYLLQIIIVPGSLMGVVRQIQDIIRYTFYIKNAEHDSKTK